MCSQVAFLICTLVYFVYSAKVPFEKIGEAQAIQAPFFELPCMRIGGTCAKAFACPTGTRVGRRGLCPDQQELGIECCRPNRVARPLDQVQERKSERKPANQGKTNIDNKCITRNGVCIATGGECPQTMQIEGTSDCKSDEICCIYNQ
ncbi:unnamed protein product [Spodoptera littoralis]|uniref:Uncharacterized protein n=1 Tax=Spodoptera littoralis TaxID=7109 RepID=A0A9P0IBD4_SPOLI|nr:unnamed protein product [Spodoptera littoralis]CAH1643124.1 unnamed protein product [Spodoptera littoralis]